LRNNKKSKRPVCLHEPKNNHLILAKPTKGDFRFCVLRCALIEVVEKGVWVSFAQLSDPVCKITHILGFYGLDGMPRQRL